jgi:hypothetical protein
MLKTAEKITNMLKYVEIRWKIKSWNVLKHVEIVGKCWNMLKLNDVETCWNMLEHVKQCWHIVKSVMLKYVEKPQYVEIGWNMLKHVEICQNMLAYAGKCWKCWDTLKYFKYVEMWWQMLQDFEIRWNTLNNAENAEIKQLNMVRHAEVCQLPNAEKCRKMWKYVEACWNALNYFEIS